MNRTRSFFFVCAGLFGIALLLPRPAAAAWPTDPSEPRRVLRRAPDLSYATSVWVA